MPMPQVGLLCQKGAVWLGPVRMYLRAFCCRHRIYNVYILCASLWHLARGSVEHRCSSFHHPVLAA
jgi:hypothetical protein